MSIKPISPDKIVIQKLEDLPDDVIKCWNSVIARKWTSINCSMITIDQDEIVENLVKTMNVKRKEIFEKGWLEVEALYEDNGWKVEYDSPGYNENYRPFFRFRKK